MDRRAAMERAARRRFRDRARAAGVEMVGDALDRYARINGVDRPQLAALLGCDEGGLERMALCTLPRSDHFEQDVEAIAGVGSASAAALGPLLRAYVAANRHSLVAEPPAPYSTKPDKLEPPNPE